MEFHKTSTKYKGFSNNDKKLCWETARTISGRNADRWRLDAVGNPVLQVLEGCAGPFCYEYDCIRDNKPLSFENCRILQTAVSKYKAYNPNATPNQLKAASVETKPTGISLYYTIEKQMNLLERAMYGNIMK
jgi:hypothetical protein